MATPSLDPGGFVGGSVGQHPDSPLDVDDMPYPCKGCGEILEEGRAFELAGNRWHIDCFRCNTCNTLLDSDANLLLLADGSLICNNCTYSCISCGDKIEDLAILTGDQAFCANCFKCRNCKRKIENLRYARTSQGIFCMDCHEALMARRRKRTGRGTGGLRSKMGTSGSKMLDKSLPAIPPEPRFQAAENEAPSPSPSELRSRDRDGEQGKWQETATTPESQPDSDIGTHAYNTVAADPHGRPDVSTVRSTAAASKRLSFTSHHSDGSPGADEYLIPVAFDPSPPTVHSAPLPSSATPALTDTSSAKASPHIAYQDKGRQTGATAPATSASTSSVAVAPTPSINSTTTSASSGSATASPDTSDHFRLQDAPRSKRPARGSPSNRNSAVFLADPAPRIGRPGKRAGDFDDDSSVPAAPRQSEDSSGSSDSPRPPQHPQILAHLPKRGDSLDGARRSQGSTGTASSSQTIPRKELSSTALIPAALSDLVPGSSPPGAKATPELGNDASSDVVKPAKFVDPRAPPPPPLGIAHSRNVSASTLQSQVLRAGDLQISPSLPRYSAGTDFAMDEELARILGSDGSSGPNQQGSFLRRVSNSVRHGRSYSDKPTGRLSKDRWPRSPGAGPGTSLAQEISSPTSASPENKEEIAWFRNELRRERQKLIDREKRIAELEAQLDSTAEIKQVNSELREKRSTMVVLDTQKEIVVRELEVLTDHIAAAKASEEPFDASKLTGTVLRDFAQSLDKLKNSFAPQIEDFIQRRNDLIDEIASLSQMKDKSLLEFEQLSSKNAQLAELNNQLVHQIQGLYKANSGATPELARPGPGSAVNGLGIYAHKDRSNLSLDSAAIRNAAADLASLDSATTLTAGEAESVTLFQAPQVVNIRKGGQPKKFDWRKGQKVAKGVTKGLKGAFSSAQQSYGREMQFAETGAYGQQPLGQEPSANRPAQPAGGGFGFFGPGSNNQKGAANTKPNGLYATPSSQANTSTPSLILDPSTHLFGVDLEQRAEYEKTSVPEIVRRCVEEVEARGMDVEGIYRKSGGNSQVQQVRDSFERDVYSADISDPDLDIHAVTSGLKQYFRKLPTPLITYEIYDKLLETTSISDPDARIEAMRDAVRQLPPVHYATLEFLMNHLARVVLQEKDNLMTSMNVAVVFAPTIMRPESITRELGDTKAKNDCCMWIVDHVSSVFTN
ncbi:hypothetical protein DV738_g3085, partial [Chaetothyriales sp. CBS 135597]